MNLSGRTSMAVSRKSGVKITPILLELTATCSEDLASEAVQGAALALEGIDHIEGGHSLPAGVLGVGHSIADDVLKEHLQHAAGLLIDEAADALDTTTASQTTDGGLGDALDVVTEHLPVALGTALAQALAALAASRHACLCGLLVERFSAGEDWYCANSC